ncbi:MULTISPECIES: winged helix-turn-helix transcriptional regulator [Streptomyces]|uniref:Helix-turn-helix transcriptional regulator n=1 Tax=Streptomyces lavenduligriseus TaxID=67315 RepID=A0ABT0NT62_9ACTN|nr:helix-turn-helix domain-containing protein [Streptomyces lavenduligriseus]MCL3994346.1 helix-turn-helix transcriptional regulator [Streptomyces lavenduligriseus]WDM15982.1 helix-turn-helix transcriptional regulator [Streptomyces lavenduligriseus]
MVARTRLDADPCPVARSIDAIGDWWSLLIVRDAFDGSRRFGQFQRSLGIAKNILTTRLRALERAGVMETVPASDGSPYQEYVLTEKGRALFPVIVALRQWGESHCFAPGEAHSRLLDRRDRRPLSPLEIRSGDGRPIGPEETVVEKLDPADGTR